MIREMIRQFLRQPGEFLTFGQLAFRIPGSDKELLYLVAESRPDFFAVARNERALKLYTKAVQEILQDRIEAGTDAPDYIHPVTPAPEGRIRFGHFGQEELPVDLNRCSLPSEALTRICCWAEICRIRALCHPPIEAEVQHCPEVILVEGLFDYAVLRQAGFRHATCSLGTHLNVDQFRQLCDRPRTVYLTFDVDANGTGQQASQQLAQRLCAQGITTRRVLLPEGHDPNSFFVQGGDARQFQSLLEAAPP